MTDKGFFYWIIQYLGGRSYNCYLDYSLFAIKINTIMDQFHTWKEGQNESMKEAVEDLLWDDRHDCWQNLPYSLERFVEPMEKEKQEIFWDLIVEAMIQCINVEGTGDVSPKFYVKER